MSKSILVSLAMLAGLGASAAAMAQSQPSSTSATQTSSSKQSASPIKPGDRNCIRDTGSLLKAKPGECLPVTGRSYSQKDIQNTGQTQLGPALQDLDPSVTVHGR
jgi:TolA-binding protein